MGALILLVGLDIFKKLFERNAVIIAQIGECRYRNIHPACFHACNVNIRIDIYGHLRQTFLLADCSQSFRNGFK